MLPDWVGVKAPLKFATPILFSQNASMFIRYDSHIPIVCGADGYLGL